MRLVVALLLASAMISAGCIDSGELETDDGLPEEITLFARGEPLWHAPQDFPHPAFGWGTLTNPPAGEDVPDWWKPVPRAQIPERIEGLGHEVHLEGIDTGGGFAAFGSLVVLPGWDVNTHIIDISDPSEPKILSSFEPNTRGAVIIPYPDGRLVTVMSTTAELHVFDITDPEDPEHLRTLEPAQGSHKVGVVPGTPIVYNAANDGGGGAPDGYDPATAIGVTEIYDLSDPENPEHVQDWDNGYSCHHIYFHNDPSKDLYRAYCAGREMTQIWDTSDPRSPEVVSNIPVHHGNPDLPPNFVSGTFWSHSATVNLDATVLIVGDEPGGGRDIRCDVHAQVGDQTVSGPVGNLWFYDISDETDPQLLGWLSPTAPPLTHPPVVTDNPPDEYFCTAHHGRMVPDPEGERDLMVWGFYGAGVLLIDFTDASNPKILEQWNEGADVWEVWYYDGWILTGDIARGFDVFTLE